MTIRDCVLFLAIMSFIYAGNLLFVVIVRKKSYRILKEEKESFFDFIVRVYEKKGRFWQRKDVRKFYNNGGYFSLSVFLIVVCICIGSFLLYNYFSMADNYFVNVVLR